jgi:hypothetical protein
MTKKPKLLMVPSDIQGVGHFRNIWAAQCIQKNFFNDFEIDINNNYKIDVSIYKVDRKSDEKENDTYRYQFKFMDDIETIENDTIRNIHFTIGSNIARMLDKKLK